MACLRQSTSCRFGSVFAVASVVLLHRMYSNTKVEWVCCANRRLTAVIHELDSDLRLWVRYSGFVRWPYLVILPLTHWPQGSTDHPIVHTFKRLPRKAPDRTVSPRLHNAALCSVIRLGRQLCLITRLQSGLLRILCSLFLLTCSLAHCSDTSALSSAIPSRLSDRLSHWLPTHNAPNAQQSALGH